MVVAVVPQRGALQLLRAAAAARRRRRARFPTHAASHALQTRTPLPPFSTPSTA